MVLQAIFKFFFVLTASASPHPLTASSIINNTQTNIVYSQLGFQISSVPTGWIYKNISDLKSQSIELGPTDPLAKSTLSFRVEAVGAKTNLEQYVRQYLRDYNQYGFEVTGLQSNKKNRTPSVIVDLTQKNKLTRSRQVFFLKNNKIVIATCLDSFENFEKLILSCNQILGAFEYK